jgi:hypothetical protein
MGDWISKHPWMTFFLGLAGIGAVRAILSPAAPPALPATASITVLGVLPHGTPMFDGAQWWQPTLLSASDGNSYDVTKSYNLINYGGGNVAPSIVDQSRLVTMLTTMFVGKTLAQAEQIA